MNRKTKRLRKKRNTKKREQGKARGNEPKMDKFVDFLYYNETRPSHFIHHNTRLMSNIGFTRTCFIALCIMLVSYVLTSLEVDNYADLQKLMVELIIGTDISFGNAILLSDTPKPVLIKGSLEKALRYYIDKEDNILPTNEIIRRISKLNIAFKGNFGPNSHDMIVRGTTEHIRPCTTNYVDQEGTFFHEFPLDVPIPIAITTRREPIDNVWEVDDWGCVVISCISSRYMIRWYGAYGSDHIQISFGGSEPIPLEEFYSLIDESGVFHTTDERFREFIEKFILRRIDYEKVPDQPLPRRSYSARVTDEVRPWISGNFKMIAFMANDHNIIDEIGIIVHQDGIVEASKHLKL